MHRKDCRFFYMRKGMVIDGYGSGGPWPDCSRSSGYFHKHGCDVCPWAEMIPESKATFKARKRKFKRDLKLQFKRER